MDKEIRIFNTEIEYRSGEGEKPAEAEGHFLVFDERVQIMPGYYEEIASTALDNVMDDDVRVLFNHDENKILARTKAKPEPTATIDKDDKGGIVRWSFPKTTYADDLRESMKRGDVSQMSFAFRVKKVEWTDFENGDVLRRITEFEKLYDVSPVTFPAYPTTDVALRSMQDHKKEIEQSRQPVDFSMKEKHIRMMEIQ
jgi:HK97 family phage prohead protease